MGSLNVVEACLVENYNDKWTMDSVMPQSEHSAPSTDVEDPLCQVRVVTILRTSNMINLYTPDNNFLTQIIIFWKS